MRFRMLLLSAVVVTGCSKSKVEPVPTGAPRPASAVAVHDAAKGPKKLGGVPPGHYPPPGQCRLWYAGRPPGHQPRSGPCEALVGRVPHGAFVLYNGAAWDADYDWRAHERRHSGSVPNVILRVLVGGPLP